MDVKAVFVRKKVIWYVKDAIQNSITGSKKISLVQGGRLQTLNSIRALEKE